MFKKIMNHLTNNIGLKILSIVFALVLWLIVVNYDDPEISATFIVPVEVTGEELLEDMGKVYEVDEDSRFATFYVRGKRSIVENLSSSDFTATADLNQIIDLQEEADEKRVPITITAKKYKDKITINQRSVNLKIYIENLSTSKTYVSVSLQGDPAESYAIGEVSVSPNLINISGPQSVVSRIKKAVATVDVDEMMEDSTTNVPLVLYDDNNEIIESTQLKMSQNVVTVSVQILGTKSVPVRCETTGTPADGYYFSSLEYAPNNVIIKGEPHILNYIKEIVIPGDAISLEGVTADVENNVDINPYLPEGVSLVNADENKIAVKAVIEALETKNLELPVSSLEVLNLPEDYEVTYNDVKVIIPVRGKSEDIEGLTEEQITASINLEDKNPGLYTVEVNVVLNDKFEVMRDITLQINIKEIGNGSEETPGTPADGEDTGTGTGTGTGSEGSAEDNMSQGTDRRGL